jgi:hypothetical protein
MKVFLSWSGARSMAAAELLKWWTRSIIQAARPWISTEDVDRGSLWFSEINDNLSDTSIGIVCLTQENKDRPWILFEAGALAKGLSNSRVCTFLVDLTPSDIRDPLAQFNHTQPKEDDMRKLARTLNRQLGENALEETVLAGAFDAYWPQFQVRWADLMKNTPDATHVEKREPGDIMSEILDNVRGMSQRIRALENQATSKSSPSISKTDHYKWLKGNVYSKWAEIEKMVHLDASKVDWTRAVKLLLEGGKSADEVIKLLTEGGLSESQATEMVVRAQNLPPMDDD